MSHHWNRWKSIGLLTLWWQKCWFIQKWHINLLCFIHIVDMTLILCFNNITNQSVLKMSTTVASVGLPISFIVMIYSLVVRRRLISRRDYISVGMSGYVLLWIVSYVINYHGRSLRINCKVTTYCISFFSIPSFSINYHNFTKNFFNGIWIYKIIETWIILISGNSFKRTSAAFISTYIFKCPSE